MTYQFLSKSRTRQKLGKYDTKTWVLTPEYSPPLGTHPIPRYSGYSPLGDQGHPPPREQTDAGENITVKITLNNIDQIELPGERGGQ